MSRWIARSAVLALLMTLSACSALDARPPAPTPSPTITDAAIVNNTACLKFYDAYENWSDTAELALSMRAIIPDADEFLAGQLTNFANALDGIETDVPIGQAEAIAESQIDRVCLDAGVPEPYVENVPA